MQGEKNISIRAVAEGCFDGGGYAFCRLPGASVYHYLAQAGMPEHLDTLHSCSGKSGYVVAPFHPHPSTPALLIVPDLHETCTTPQSVTHHPITTTISDNGREQYAKAFSMCQELLNDGTCEKIVLSRRMHLNAEGTPNPVALFQNACVAHPNHYVALWWTAETGLWLVATPEVLLDYIGSVSYPNNKARHLVGLAQALVERHGGEVPSSHEALTALPGVGRKSANLIMGDVFGKPAIVTDTHCIRLCNKIGLVDDIKEPQKVEMALWKIVPPEEGNDLCHRFVLHGRAVCNARHAACERCCLADVCKPRKLSVNE